MVDMKCPITGTVLHVPEERVEKLERAGYKRIVEKVKEPAKRRKPAKSE